VLNYIKIKFNIVKLGGKNTTKTLKKETKFDTSKGMNRYYMSKFQQFKGFLSTCITNILINL